MPESASPDVPSAQDEVVDICRDLIRIDSTNYGDGSGPQGGMATKFGNIPDTNASSLGCSIATLAKTPRGTAGCVG